jgi:hypothetical protein
VSNAPSPGSSPTGSAAEAAPASAAGPDPWAALLTERAWAEHQIDRELAAAARLRTHAEAIAGVLEPLVAFDRPDVWTGERAEQFRRDITAVRTRLLSAWAGTVEQVRAAADRIEALAAQRRAQLTPVPDCSAGLSGIVLPPGTAPEAAGGSIVARGPCAPP